MAITTFTVDALGGSAFRLNFASDVADAIFYVWRDGTLVAQTTQNSLLVYVAVGEVPVYEVFDDEGDEPTSTWPAYATLSWYQVSGAGSYLVEQYIAAVWTEQVTITDGGQGYFTWRSGTLADSTTHQFRVTAIGSNANAGTATTFNVLMVRNPSPPEVSFTYNGAGTPTVTIAAA